MSSNYRTGFAILGCALLNLGLSSLRPAIADTEPSSEGVSPEQLHVSSEADLLLLPDTAEQLRTQRVESLTLDRALQLARENNRQLQTASLAIREAEADLRAARAAWYPSLTLGSDVTRFVSSEEVLEQRLLDRERIRTSNTRLDDPVTEWDSSLTLEFTLYDAERSSSIQLAEQQLQLARLQFEQAIREVRLDTTTAYLQLQQAVAAVEIARLSQGESQHTLDDAEVLLQAAFATRADVLQAQVELANRQQQFITAQSEVEQAQSALVLVLGLPTGTTATAADPLTANGEWTRSVEESLLHAWQHRPELAQALVQRRIAQLNGQVALAGIRPTLDLDASVDALKLLEAGEGLSPEIIDTGFGVGYDIELSANWTFFDGGEALAEADSAAVEATAAEVQFAQTREQIRNDVEQSYSSLRANETNLQIARNAESFAEDNLEATRLRRQAGVGTQTDVIVAEVGLLQARTNTLDAIVNYNTSLADLERQTLLDADPIPESELEPAPNP